MLASRYGHTEIAKYLIEAKASVDLQTQVCCVQMKIISRWFSLRIGCFDNFTLVFFTDWVLRCLHHAINNGHIDITKYLIEAKAPSLNLQEEAYFALSFDDS